MKNSKDVNTELFEKWPMRKAFLTLAVPTVLSQVIVIFYSLADSFFVGRLGDPDQVAALTISFPVFNMLTVFANIFGIGASGVISRSLGSGNRKRAANASAIGFWGAIGSALIMMLAVFCCMKQILSLLGANSHTYTYTCTYIIWVVLAGGAPTELSLLLGHIIRSEGRAKEAGFGMMLGGLLNILLDPLFIFGFHMGVGGAGAATMLSNTVSALFLFAVLFRIRSHTALSLHPKRITLRDGVLGDLISTGLPSGLNTFLVNIDNAIMSGITALYSNQVVAAYGITQKITTTTIHVSQGMAQGVLPLIGYNFSQGNLTRVRQANRFALRTLLIFTILFFLSIELAAGGLAGLFIDDSATSRLTAVFMRCWMFCAFGMCLFQMYNAIFQALGQWKRALILTVLRLAVFFPAAAFGLNSLCALKGLMFSQPLSDTATLILCILFYRQVKRNLFF